MPEGPDLSAIYKPSIFTPLEPGFTPVEPEHVGSQPGVSTLEEILNDSKKAFALISPESPLLQTPSLQFDPNAVSTSVAAVGSKMWDKFLENLASVEAAKKVDDKNNAIRNDGIQQQAQATDFRSIIELCAAAIGTLMNIAVLGMMFNPVEKVLPYDADGTSKTDKAVLHTMVRTVTTFLYDNDRMGGLRQAIADRVSAAFADDPSADTHAITDRSFHMTKASLAFAALGAYQVAFSRGPEGHTSAIADAKTIRDGGYDDGELVNLQQILEGELGALKDSGLMSGQDIKDWLQNMTSTVVTGARDRMDMVYTFLTKVAAQAMIRPDSSTKPI